MTLVAFHSDPGLKQFVLAQLAAHREADKLIKGAYWNDGRGCAVGCTLQAVALRNGSDIDHTSHVLYERELGIPQILARLEDGIFENLPSADAQRWPERFTNAIRPGADLSMIWPRFALWLMSEEVPRHTKNAKAIASLAEVAALYREWIAGIKPTTERWQKARRAAAADAAAAAAAAAYAAADAAAAAAAAAYAAADAYAYAYADADADAYAAADAYADADADAYAAADARKRQADKLIELLTAA